MIGVANQYFLLKRSQPSFLEFKNSNSFKIPIRKILTLSCVANYWELKFSQPSLGEIQVLH